MFSNRVILPLFNSLKKDSLKIVRLSEPNLGFIRRTFTKRKINQLGDVADPNILNTGFSRARQIPFVIKSSLFTFGVLKNSIFYHLKNDPLLCFSNLVRCWML